MILQSLVEYYERNKTNLPKFGFSDVEIPYLIVIDQNGKFIALQSTKEKQGKKEKAQTYTVPSLPKTRKASVDIVSQGKTAGVCWDHFGYLTGQAKLDKKSNSYLPKDIELAEAQMQGFKCKIAMLKEALPSVVELEAIQKFYLNDENMEQLRASEEWPNLIKKDGQSVAFRLAGSDRLACQSEEVINYLLSNMEEEEDGFCLVKGIESEIARTHEAIKYIGGTNPKLVSFNEKAFESYGKKQSFNSPISARASFEYSTALNHMLKDTSQNKFKVASNEFVCWSERGSALEEWMPVFMSTDDTEAGINAVEGLFDSIHNGAYQKPDGKDRFYLLGLAPNSARIMVRFWQVGTVAQFSENIAKWFKDIEIDGVEKFGYPPLKELLSSTALQGEDDKVPPNLPGAVVTAILNGTPLPDSLMQGVIRRIKAEAAVKKDKKTNKPVENVSPNRAALIKACLNRQIRQSQLSLTELAMALDLNNTDTSYVLGRWFATLEKIQEESHPGINATIKDRYYGAISSNPVNVFGILDRLKNHHLAKLEKGQRINKERLLGEIVGKLPARLPNRLSLSEQGSFAVGYYHQRQHLYPQEKSDQPTS